MATQPTISNSDYATIEMFNNIYGDRSVTVATGEVLAKDTVLGLDTTNDVIIACESDNAAGADVARYILMQELDNSAGEAAVEFDNIRVMLAGEFDESLAVFDNGTDTMDTLNTNDVPMRDALKTEGLIAIKRNVGDKLDNQ